MSNLKSVVAITSCPTGVAHTYMAAKGIEQEALKRGIKIKVQKNAQAGVEDQLSSEDIKNADAVIICADIKVDMSVFDGKPLLKADVKSGFTKASKLFDELELGVPLYISKKSSSVENVSTSKVDESFSNEAKGILKDSYKQLLTGVSYMLPFVVAGGILIGISFFWGIWSFDKNGHPGEYVAFAASLKAIGGGAFTLMVPVLAGYIAYSIGDRPALVPGFVGGFIANQGFDGKSSGFIGAIIAGFIAGWLIVLLRRGTRWVPSHLKSIKPIIIYPLISTLVVGLITIWCLNLALDPIFRPANMKTGDAGGYMSQWLTSMGTTSKVGLAIVLGLLISVDFGGPVNKVAYLFGVAALTTSLAAGQKSDVMAAVSAGCMAPPLATSVAVLVWRKRFGSVDKQAGYANILLGLVHITEGAIPFAAKKPLYNIPCFMIGSMIACTLSMLLGAATSAPHGGIIVIALVTKWYWWIFSIAIGATVSGLLLGLVTRPADEAKENIIFANLGD